MLEVGHAGLGLCLTFLLPKYCLVDLVVEHPQHLFFSALDFCEHFFSPKHFFPQHLFSHYINSQRLLCRLDRRFHAVHATQRTLHTACQAAHHRHRAVCDGGLFEVAVDPEEHGFVANFLVDTGKRRGKG